METPMTFTQELIEKHIKRLWNNSGCPVGEILGDIIRETLERAAQECDNERIAMEARSWSWQKSADHCAIRIRALKDKS